MSVWPSGGVRPAVGVIVVAAGSGTRLGLGIPKALVAVGEESILHRSLGAVFGMADPTQVVVVGPESHLAECRQLVATVAGAASSYATVVAGGDSRQQSVAAGLAQLLPSVRTVLVHDSARAFTPTAQFERVVAAVAATGGGAIPVLPVTDTIKTADAEGIVTATLDRSSMVAVQTPQGFPRAELDAAYASATTEYTDDAAVFAAAGRTVTTVAGDALAFKITTGWDLRRAESLAAASSVTIPRTGVGVDVHAFDDAAPLWLGGVFWPDEVGLSGHSDGDALCHAICDSLLSAAGLGDIGGIFGTDDARFAGAHGDVFVRETVARVTAAGYTIGNVAVQVIARRPKLSSRRAEIEALLSGLVGAPVSVAGTTTDGLGFTGRGDGIAVVATALISRDR
ncbi:2-C-methyl-D-erythritol 4-phosphate cytidylyltransferase [Marisediminicola senii]|uniref:2-C-methyl-D-erythritol 4-phosphate cytidylyltransferase n=1 Tax=Marisediminicola senii TaxID=2711233 RepID=UPI0013EA1DFF|nr:2-C-methyl-D-erythritol 4-phosphate cytidylyltransferase [Marisediminicola senii]